MIVVGDGNQRESLHHLPMCLLENVTTIYNLKKGQVRSDNRLFTFVCMVFVYKSWPDALTASELLNSKTQWA